MSADAFAGAALSHGSRRLRLIGHGGGYGLATLSMLAIFRGRLIARLADFATAP